MRRLNPLIVLLAGMLLIPFSVFGQDRSDAMQEIVDQYRSGLVDGNADTIAQLFAEDGRIYHADGKIVEGRSEIRKDQSESLGQVNYVSVEWDPYESYFMGENVWVETGEFTGVTENDQGERNTGTYEYTAINQKIDGEWKIKRIIVYQRGS